MRGTIDLSGSEPVRRGSSRAVYPFPGDDGKLIKIVADRRVELTQRTPRGWIMRRFPTVRLRPLLREQDEFLLLAVRIDGGADLPIPWNHGFVRTSEGIGAVHEAIRRKDGRLGITLTKLVRRGAIGARECDLLTDFARRCFDCDLRVTDLVAKNVVLGRRDGAARFVLVDGYGDYHSLPWRSWSRRWNRRDLHRRMDALGREAGLRWDRGAVQFVLPVTSLERP